MALTIAIQVPLKAAHPPAAATALLIALGGFRLAPRDMTILLLGVLLTAALGEAARRFRVRP
jgi:CBS-domain-containing membrane protein